MVGGVTLGMFSLGMFFPWANSKGVIIGSLTALSLMLWIGIGSQVAASQSHLSPVRRETSVEACLCTNLTNLIPAVSTENNSDDSE